MKAFHVYDGKAYSFIKGEFDKKDLAYAESAAKIFELDPLILYGKESIIDSLTAEVLKAESELKDGIKESKSLLKNGINIDYPSANLKTIREILKSANKKSSTLFMSVDMRNHGEKSVFNNPYALRILGDNIGAARFINKYIK